MPEDLQSHQFYILMQIFANFAECFRWIKCFTFLYWINRRMKVYVKSHAYGQVQKLMPLQSRQIWFEEQQECTYLGCGSKVFDLFSVQHSCNRGEWKERGEKRAIWLCCPLAICKWSIWKPRGLCLCGFVCVISLCWCLGYDLWCDVTCYAGSSPSDTQ